MGRLAAVPGTIGRAGQLLDPDSPVANSLVALSAAGNLINRLRDPNVSVPGKAIGSAKDVTALTSAALRTDAGRRLLSDTAGRFAPTVAQSLPLVGLGLGIGTSALDLAEGRTDAGVRSLMLQGVPTAAAAAGGAAGGAIGGGASGLAGASNAVGEVALPLAVMMWINDALSREDPMQGFQSPEDWALSWTNPISHGLRGLGTVFGSGDTRGWLGWGKSKTTAERKREEAKVDAERMATDVSAAQRLLTGQGEPVTGNILANAGYDRDRLPAEALRLVHLAMEQEYRKRLAASDPTGGDSSMPVGQKFAEQVVTAIGNRTGHVAQGSASRAGRTSYAPYDYEQFWPAIAQRLNQNLPLDATFFNELVLNPEKYVEGPRGRGTNREGVIPAGAVTTTKSIYDYSPEGTPLYTMAYSSPLFPGLKLQPVEDTAWNPSTGQSEPGPGGRLGFAPIYPSEPDPMMQVGY